MGDWLPGVGGIAVVHNHRLEQVEPLRAEDGFGAATDTRFAGGFLLGNLDWTLLVKASWSAQVCATTRFPWANQSRSWTLSTWGR